MPRPNRHKSENAAYYHLYNRAGGPTDYFPFSDRQVARKLLSLFEFYLGLYCCTLVALELMGNHFHAITLFHQFVQLSMEELRRRAQLRWGRRWERETAGWQAADWQEFNRNLFDVSKFMHHVECEFSKWFNRRTGRRGHFWADRFKNPELLDPQALQNCALYVELNAVRAGLVKRPEDWKMGSAYWRWAGKKQDLLMPLEQLFGAEPGRSTFETYRGLLYHLGAVPVEGKPGVIPDWVLRREQRRGFGQPGLFRKHLRFFNDGLAIGSAARVRELLDKYREKGRYKRRRHPIPQLEGRFFSLREQRSHAWAPG